MGYIMYVCPACRSYFKTGGADKKIKCPKCKEDFLRSLKITDEKWRLLDKDARQARINRALAGEQLRDEAPKPAPGPVLSPVAPPVKPPEVRHDHSNDVFTPDAPDEAILEARRLLEEKDVQAEMPAPRIDMRRLMIVCMTAFVLLLVPFILNIILPISSTKDELAALVQARPGDTVIYGREKKGNTWRVLDADEERILVISDHAVGKELKQGDKVAQVDWLNSAFMNSTFNVFERTRIVPAEEGDDKVFLIPEEQPSDGIYPAFWIRF